MELRKFAAVAASAALLAFAGTTAADARNVAATTTVNMRSGAGPNHYVVGRMHRGQRGDLIRCSHSGRWCLVDARRGPTGWVNARYLRRAGGGGHHKGNRICFYGAGGYICFGK